jgi:hypothetical protein
LDVAEALKLNVIVLVFALTLVANVAVGIEE